MATQISLKQLSNKDIIPYLGGQVFIKYSSITAWGTDIQVSATDILLKSGNPQTALQKTVTKLVNIVSDDNSTLKGIALVKNYDAASNVFTINAFEYGTGSGSGADAKLSENITSNVAVGAAPVNTLFAKDMTFTEFAKKILLKEIAPTITFTATNAGLYEIGDTSIAGSTLTLNISSLGTMKPKAVEFYLDGTLLNTEPYVSGQSSYTYVYNNAITTDTTMEAHLTYTKADSTSSFVSKQSIFRFVNPTYYGTVSSLTVTETDITALTKTNKTSKAHTWTNIFSNDERLCYAYPASYGSLTSIKDQNNFEYIGSYTKTTQIINSVNYFVYILTDPVTLSGFKQMYN